MNSIENVWVYLRGNKLSNLYHNDKTEKSDVGQSIILSVLFTLINK